MFLFAKISFIRYWATYPCFRVRHLLLTMANLKSNDDPQFDIEDNSSHLLPYHNLDT